jgi:protein-S-isoprenylcysteine O-methyltransferase Ste14
VPDPAPPIKVPVGTATAAVLALVAFLSGDRSEQTLGTIVAGALAIVSLAITQLGRYWQARELARARVVVPLPGPPGPQGPMGPAGASA